MKVALQISGQQRYGAYWPQLLSTLEQFDHDIFIHNWEGPRDETQLRTIVGQHAMIQLEPQIQFEVPKEWRKTDPEPYGSPIFNLMSMTYGIQAANKLRQASGNNYDIVIRARSDHRIILPDPLEMAPNTIEVGRRPYYLRTGTARVQDQFAIATPAMMDVYAEQHDQMWN